MEKKRGIDYLPTNSAHQGGVIFVKRLLPLYDIDPTVVPRCIVQARTLISIRSKMQHSSSRGRAPAPRRSYVPLHFMIVLGGTLMDSVHRYCGSLRFLRSYSRR